MATRTYHIRYQIDREYFSASTDSRYNVLPYGFNQFINCYATTILAKLFYPPGGGLYYKNTTSAVNGYEESGNIVNGEGTPTPPAYYFNEGVSGYSLNLVSLYDGTYSKASWNKIGWGTDYATFTNNVIAWCQNNVSRIPELSYSTDINVIIWWNDLDLPFNPGNNLCSTMIYVGNDTSSDETRTLDDTSSVVNITDLTLWS